jgi:hypothetical protein
VYPRVKKNMVDNSLHCHRYMTLWVLRFGQCPKCWLQGSDTWAPRRPGDDYACSAPSSKLEKPLTKPSSTTSLVKHNQAHSHRRMHQVPWPKWAKGKVIKPCPHSVDLGPRTWFHQCLQAK